jgi:hypothetical protein
MPQEGPGKTKKKPLKTGTAEVLKNFIRSIGQNGKNNTKQKNKNKQALT